MKHFASESNKKVVFKTGGAATKASFATNKHYRESGRNDNDKPQYESRNHTELTEAARSSKDNKESRNDDDNYYYDPHSVYLMSIFEGNNAGDDDNAARSCGAKSTSIRSSMKELEKALDVPYFWH
jgi:hypothetical protein